ncbi:MAG: hypothetical protein ACFE0O_07525 [Opitutales bacterium]
MVRTKRHTQHRTASVAIYSIGIHGTVTWANTDGSASGDGVRVGEHYLDGIDSTGTRHHLHRHFSNFTQERLSIVVTDGSSALFGFRIILTALLSNAGLSYLATHEPLNLVAPEARRQFEASARRWADIGWVDSQTFRAACPEISGPAPTPVPFPLAPVTADDQSHRRRPAKIQAASWLLAVGQQSPARA